MSKASKWVEQCLKARENSPKTAPLQGRTTAFEVDYRTGNLKIEKVTLSPENALEVAHWIIDTFQD